MNLSLHKNCSLSPSTIKQQLIKRHLLDSSLQKAQIFYQIKKFIDFYIGEHINNLQPTQKTIIIQLVLNTFDSSLKDKTKLFWMKTFVIHAFFKFIILNCTEKRIMFDTLLQQISEIKTQILSNKTKQSSSLVIRSLSKIKRSLSSSSLKKMFGVENEQAQGKPNKLNELQRSILLQYVMYLQKIIHDWFEMQELVSPQKNRVRSKPSISQELKTNLVWKIFNIFKKLSRVTQDYLKIHQLFKDYSIYFYSMMNFISEDVAMLYNPLVDEVRTRIKAVNWEKVMESLQMRENDKDKGQEVTSSDKIMEIYSMVEELGNANQVVLYVLFGWFHSNYLYKRSKPQNFVSINESEFDMIYAAAKKITEEKNKFQNKKKVQQSHKLKEKITGNIFVNNLTTDDSSNGMKTQRESQCEDRLLMGGNNKFAMMSRGDVRMKAVNYKSQKLREMEKQSVKKQ